MALVAAAVRSVLPAVAGAGAILAAAAAALHLCRQPLGAALPQLHRLLHDKQPTHVRALRL